jgi:hypothetical protein
MKTALLVTLVALSLLSIFSIIPTTIIPAHALPSGVVCIATVTSTTCDPSKPASVTSSSAGIGSAFTVGVNVYNSDALNGFAISLHVNSSILKPLNATIDGSIIPTLPGTFFTANPANCVNNGVGFAVGAPGNIGCSGVDGNGTTTFAFLSVGGLSAQPITGRLFTAAYEIVGATNSSGTPIGYVVTGTPTPSGTATCTGTSVQDTCLTITNGGTGGPVPESLAEKAIFTTQSAAGSFSITANPAFLSIIRGSSGSSTITVTGIGSFSGKVNLTIAVSPIISTGPTATLTSGNVTVYAGTSANSTLLISTTSSTPYGSYSILVNATSGSAFSSVQVQVTVPAPDFQLATSANALTLIDFGRVSSTITVTGLNEFTGQVNLTATASDLPSAIVSVSPDKLILSSGVPATANLNITIPNGVLGNTYAFVVTGTSGNIFHTIGVNVTVILVPDFTIVSTQTSINIPLGSSNSTTITIGAQYGFQGSISLTATSPRGLQASLNSSAVSLTSASPNATVKLTILAPSTLTAGDYPITVIGSNATVSHSLKITIHVTDVSISSNIGSVRIAPGASDTLLVTVTSVNGFSGNATISVTVSGRGVIASCSPETLTLQSAASATCILTLSVPAATSPGIYNVTVIATQGTVSHSITVPVTVGAPPQSSPPNILGLSPVNFYAIIGGAAVAISLLVLAISRARRRNVV